MFNRNAWYGLVNTKFSWHLGMVDIWHVAAIQGEHLWDFVDFEPASFSLDETTSQFENGGLTGTIYIIYP